MDDVVLAQMLRTGDLGATGSVFDRYAHELFDYAVNQLDDEKLAADALHDAFLVAVGWAAALDEPAQLRLWLFALVRNECLRRRAEPAPRRPGESAHRSRGLVRRSPYSTEALREVFELVHRHLMEDRELAVLLGVSPHRARSMRARAEVAFAGLGVTFMPYRASRRADPPHGLRERVLTSVAAPGRVAYRADLAAPRRRTGFPVPLDSVALYRRMRAVRLTAAVGVPVLALALMLVLPSAFPGSGILSLSGPRTAAPSPGDDVTPLGKGYSQGDTDSSPSPSPSASSPPQPKPTSAARPKPVVPGGAGEAPRPSAAPRSATPRKPAPKPQPEPQPQPKPAPAPKPKPPAPAPVPPAPAPPAPAPAPPKPQPRPLVGAFVGLAGKCLDVRASGTAPGTPVILFSCNGTSAQRWTLAANGRLSALGNCAQPTANRSGAQLVMRPCNSSAVQRWTRSGTRLINAGAGLCLDVPQFRTDDYTQLIVWRCNGQTNQQWRLRTS